MHTNQLALGQHNKMGCVPTGAAVGHAGAYEASWCVVCLAFPPSLASGHTKCDTDKRQDDVHPLETVGC